MRIKKHKSGDTHTHKNVYTENKKFLFFKILLATDRGQNIRREKTFILPSSLLLSLVDGSLVYRPSSKEELVTK